MSSAAIKLLGEFGLKTATGVAPFIVRHFYKAGRLQAGLKIRIVERGQGIWMNCGELPEFRAWLRVTNLTLFDLTIDRLYGHLCHGSQLAEFQSLERREVPTRSEMEFMVSGKLAAEHVAFVRKNLGQRFETYLNLSGFVHSRLQNFEITGREVRTGNVEIINCSPPA